MSKVPLEVTEAIRNNTEIPDEKLKQLSLFTSVMVNKRGNPSPEDVECFLTAGYTEHHILSIVLAISIKTISNYSNHLFDTELDSVMKMREKTGYKVARRVLKFFKG
jgi:alkylhydroperoxidase family enzyme